MNFSLGELCYFSFIVFSIFIFLFSPPPHSLFLKEIMAKWNIVREDKKKKKHHTGAGQGNPNRRKIAPRAGTGIRDRVIHMLRSPIKTLSWKLVYMQRTWWRSASVSWGPCEACVVVSEALVLLVVIHPLQLLPSFCLLFHRVPGSLRGRELMETSNFDCLST